MYFIKLEMIRKDLPDEYVFHQLKIIRNVCFSIIQSMFSLSWLSICSPAKPKCSEFLTIDKLTMNGMNEWNIKFKNSISEPECKEEGEENM